MNEPDAVDQPETPARERILEAATRLVAEGGLAGLTTRAVVAAAGVQAPTLYRLFGDKRGLLHALAEEGLAGFVAAKAAAEPHDDPVQDLRAAWDDVITFGLQHPAVFAIMNQVGREGGRSPAARRGLSVLEARVHRIALAGQLGVAEPLAVAMIHAAGTGVVTTLLSTAAAQPDAALSSAVLDAVLAAILTERARPRRRVGSVASLAIGLRARLSDSGDLSPGEHLLLTELLDKLSN